MKITAVVFTAILSLSAIAAAQTETAVLLRMAHDAYTTAQSSEAELNDKPEAERSRSEYLKVIRAYERVYLTTPRTGYADDALLSIARLYEEIKSPGDAIKTLKFLLTQYPGTPFKDAAEKDLARLSGAKLQKTVAVDNVRYWENANSIRII